MWYPSAISTANSFAQRGEHFLRDSFADRFVKLALAWCGPSLFGPEVITFLLEFFSRNFGQNGKCLDGNVEAQMGRFEHDSCVTADGKVDHVESSWMLETCNVVSLPSNHDVPLFPSDVDLLLFFRRHLGAAKLPNADRSSPLLALKSGTQGGTQLILLVNK
jgi:hypothetical protein